MSLSASWHATPPAHLHIYASGSLPDMMCQQHLFCSHGDQSCCLPCLLVETGASTLGLSVAMPSSSFVSRSILRLKWCVIFLFASLLWSLPATGSSFWHPNHRLPFPSCSSHTLLHLWAELYWLCCWGHNCSPNCQNLQFHHFSAVFNSITLSLTDNNKIHVRW